MSINENRFTNLVRAENNATRLGISVKYLCLSLRCEYHTHLHGELLDFDKVKEIYSLNVVPNKCCCAITQVLIDEHGQPKDSNLLERLRLQAHTKNS